jgi:hypothetical protein
MKTSTTPIHYQILDLIEQFAPGACFEKVATQIKEMMIAEFINKKWETSPYMEISPVEWNSPKAYNQDQFDIII